MTPSGPTASSEKEEPREGDGGGVQFRRTVLWPSLFLFFAMLNLTLVVAGLKELILDELGGSERDASLFFSIEMLAYVIFAPLWGVASDRVGRRKPFVVIGFLLSGVAYAACARATTLPSILLLRFFQGAASVMGWSTLMAMVLDQPDNARRGRYMGVMGAALTFGIALGAPLGGLISRWGGPRAPLWCSAGLFLALALAAAVFLRDLWRTRRQTTLGEIVGALRRQPRLVVPWLFQFVDRFTVGFFVILFPLFVAASGVDDPGRRGLYLAAFMLPFAGLQIVTGRLAEKLGPYPPLLAGSFAYGLVLCVVGTSSLYALWWVMAVLGTLASVMFPPSILLTAQLSDPATRGSAMGGFNLAGSLGFAVGPLVGAWAREIGGFGLTFVVAGASEILLVAVTLALLTLWRRSDRGS